MPGVYTSQGTGSAVEVLFLRWLVMKFRFEQSPLILQIVNQAPLNELGPGHINQQLVNQIENCSDAELFEPYSPIRPNLALAVRAGLLLLADDLEQSHTISQDLEDQTGSYWHGIMHRREPDDSNACYWFARVGRHPIYPLVSRAAQQIALAELPQYPWDRADYLTENHPWYGEEFVKLCSIARRGSATQRRLCQLIQQQEIYLLLDYCWHEAVHETA
jgi:hypothetical protein